MTNAFFLTKWFFYAVRWFYSEVGSYFLTILIITLILRLIQVFPDIKSRRSQQKMTAIQPEIAALQKKYANNPQQLNIAQRKLMKERGVSMWSGCLPMLLTMPIFFCFLAAFRHWGYEQTVKLTYETLENPAQAQETFDSFDFLWITNIWQPDSGMAPVVPTAQNVHSYQGIENLAILSDGYDTPDGEHVSGEEIWSAFKRMGLASGELGSGDARFLPNAAAEKVYTDIMTPYVKQHAGYSNGWFILPILAAALQFLSAWISQKQTEKSNPDAPSQGKMMLFLFPIMSIVFCLSSTSAFALYWTLSSLFQIISMFIMSKAIASKPVAQSVIDAPVSKTVSRHNRK